MVLQKLEYRNSFEKTRERVPWPGRVEHFHEAGKVNWTRAGPGGPSASARQPRWLEGPPGERHVSFASAACPAVAVLS